MRHEIVPIRDVQGGLVKAWHRLQDADPDLCSPFFGAGFAQAVGRHVPNLRVAVIEEDGAVCGILPFHAKAAGCAVPVGGQICDYQGVIGQALTPGERGQALLHGCGMAAYDYNHGLASQTLLARNAFASSISRRADLREGIEAWRVAVGAQTKELGKLGRKRRKIEREIGPLRYVPHDSSPAAWSQFVDWKNAALARIGAPSLFGLPWFDGLVDDLRDTQTDRFAGLFSTLYAGDRLIAAHFGIRSASAWHWWFPSYDAALSPLSPGLILLVDCIEEAARRGLLEIDFGRGEELFKRQFGTDARPLCEGSLERVGTPAGALRAARKTAQRAANHWLPERAADILRRGGTKVLRAGLL